MVSVPWVRDLRGEDKLGRTLGGWGMSKKNVVRLLVRLFGDPRHLEKLRRNPAATLAAAGLTPAESELVLSGSDAKIRAYLGADSDRAAIQAKTVAIKGKTAAIKGKTAAIKGKTTAIKGKTAAIKGKTAAIKGKTAAIKGKTAAIKGKTAAIKGKTVAIKGKTAAIKAITSSAPAAISESPMTQTSLLDETTS